MSKCDKVKLSELIIQKTDTEQIVDMENEHYITLSLYGKGARERVIKDGKYPVPFTGYRVSSGQFIYSRIDARNGAYAIIGPELDGFVVSKDFPVFDINESKVLPHFLRRAVLSAAFINQVKNSSFGATNRMRIKEDVFKTYSIPLPELSKQNEIVDIMDRVETIINSRQQELQKLDDLIKARFIEMFGTINDNKYGYDIKTLQDVCEQIKDGTHQTPKYTEDKENGYKFLSSKDVTSGKIDWSNIKYIPESLHDELYARIAPQRGDLLLAKNGTTGVAAVVDCDEVFDIYVSLALLRPMIDIDSVYLWAAVNSDETKHQFDGSLKGIGVPNLHLGEIKKTKVLVPPLDKQRCFSAFLEQVDKSKAAVQKSLDETQVLFDSLMQKYFG